MSLYDLNDQLHNPDADVEKRKTEGNLSNIRFSSTGEKFPEAQTEWQALANKARKISPKGKIQWKKYAMLGTLVSSLLAVLAVGAYEIQKARQTAFSEDKVSFSIDGPSEADSTYPVTFVIHYKNDNRISLNNAEAVLNYAQNFEIEKTDEMKENGPNGVRIPIGTVSSRSEGAVEVKGKFYAPQNHLVYLRGTLDYSPSGFNSLFQLKKQIDVLVKSSPLTADVSVPREAADQSTVDYVITYQNNGSRIFNGLKLNVGYPNGFQFQKADPVPTDGTSSWYLGGLNPGEGGKISIRGIISGERNEEKKLTAAFGVIGENGELVTYSEGDGTTKIVRSPILAVQSVNGELQGIASPGQNLNYRIAFRNEGDVGLKNVVVTLQLKSSVLDFSKMRLQKGLFDAAKNTISWRAGDVPELANIGPMEERVINFDVPVLDAKNLADKNVNGKNFFVASLAKIDSPDLPVMAGRDRIVSSNEVEVRIASPITLEAKAFYVDQNQKNSGPLPPKVGQETTYTMHWQISNLFNELSGVKVVSSLPTGVRWLGNTYPGWEKISYDERTNQIVWDAANVNAGTGIFGDKREISFQVGLIPNVSQVDNPAPIVNAAKLSGKDTFINQDVNVEGNSKDTALYEDANIPEGSYRVQL